MKLTEIWLLEVPLIISGGYDAHPKEVEEII